MRRIVLTIAFCLVCVNLAFAAPFRSVVNARSTTNVTTLPVGSTDVLRTKSIDVKYIRNDQDTGVLYKATSSGEVNVALEMQISYKPSTDGLADSDYLPSNFIDSSIVDEDWHLVTLDTVILPYLRFILLGQGSNHSSTTLEIKVSK